MSPIWYCAVKKFSPSDVERWQSYINWAKLPQLTEVVSLDISLCPNVIRPLLNEDWKYNVHQDGFTSFFENLEYLLSRTRHLHNINILALAQEPDQETVQSFEDSRFIFQGFDLIETPGTGISALVNCGGFDLAFKSSDLNQVGLLSDLTFAQKVQRQLKEYYPDEHHAFCTLWAIWKFIQ